MKKSSLPPLLIRPSVERLVSDAYLISLSYQLSQDYQTQNVTEKQLKTIGLALWQALNLKANSVSQALLIDCYHPLIHLFPWECLYHPELGFLGQQPGYALSRRVSITRPLVQSPLGPLKILHFIAQPHKFSSQQTHLNLEIEQQKVLTTLEPFIESGQVYFYIANDGRFTTFVELLNDQTWHVVLLSGHGLFKQESAFFVFENEENSAEFIAAKTLAQLMGKTQVQCMVIAACQSGQFLTQTNLIKPIAQAGIPHVVGMRESLIDRAGQVFVETFCLALAQKFRVDLAVQKGRCATTQLLATDEVWRDTQKPSPIQDPSVGQWCLPLLLTHDPMRPLLNWDFQPQPFSLKPKGHSITLPEVFIGRRQELQTLSQELYEGRIQRLLIHGTGGLGKTALAGRLTLTLAQQGYQIFAYQMGAEQTFIASLAQVLGQSSPVDLMALGYQLRQNRWVLWIEHLDRIQNPQDDLLIGNSIQQCFNLLESQTLISLRIILTSRWLLSQVKNFNHYELKPPIFTDFYNYIQYLGLPYSPSQSAYIYKKFKGNFQGVQLLQSLPVTTEIKTFKNQVEIVKRYLQAHCRIRHLKSEEDP